MSKHDYHTSTVDGARAHAERHAEPDYDDRPTRADCDREAAWEQWYNERMEKIISDLEDIESRLEEVGEPEVAEQVDKLISRLS